MSLIFIKVIRFVSRKQTISVKKNKIILWWQHQISNIKISLFLLIFSTNRLHHFFRFFIRQTRVKFILNRRQTWTICIIFVDIFYVLHVIVPCVREEDMSARYDIADMQAVTIHKQANITFTTMQFLFTFAHKYCTQVDVIYTCIIK